MFRLSDGSDMSKKDHKVEVLFCELQKKKKQASWDLA